MDAGSGLSVARGLPPLSLSGSWIVMRLPMVGAAAIALLEDGADCDCRLVTAAAAGATDPDDGSGYNWLLVGLSISNEGSIEDEDCICWTSRSSAPSATSNDPRKSDTLLVFLLLRVLLPAVPCSI